MLFLYKHIFIRFENEWIQQQVSPYVEPFSHLVEILKLFISHLNKSMQKYLIK